MSCEYTKKLDRNAWTIVHAFRPKSENVDSGKNISERESQEEPNGANFSSVAPSSEELWCVKKFDQNHGLYIVHAFRPKSDNLTPAKKDTIRKGISRGVY